MLQHHFSNALEYSIRRAQKVQEEMKLNGMQQVLGYTDDVNYWIQVSHSIQKSTETLLVNCKKVGLEVNA
jgi:hypothetical protein